MSMYPNFTAFFRGVFYCHVALKGRSANVATLRSKWIGVPDRPFKFMKNEQSTTKIKAISFCRVSSKEQADEGYSLESQEKLLEAYATDDKRDYKIDKTYKITESASGKQIRKTFKEMLAYVTERKIKIILCEKIDRLTRNMKDASTIDDWVKDKDTTGRQVHFVKENFILNADTKAHDSLVWDMKVAIARFYSNNLSEEVRKGQKEKIAQGWLPTKPPLGYRTIGDKGHKTHVIDEKIAPYIRKMFELYATGNYSTLSLVKVMYKEGLRNREGKRVGKSRLHQLLSDPFYGSVAECHFYCNSWILVKIVLKFLGLPYR